MIVLAIMILPKIIKEMERYNHPTFTKLIVRKYAFKDIVGRHQLDNMSYN